VGVDSLPHFWADLFPQIRRRGNGGGMAFQAMVHGQDARATSIPQGGIKSVFQNLRKRNSASPGACASPRPNAGKR
jgi:hypothetical protein